MVPYRARGERPAIRSVKKERPVIRLPSPSARLITHASLLLTAVLWGGNFAAFQVLLDELTPIDVVFVRGVGAGLFFALALVLARQPLPRPGRRDTLRLIGVGLLGVTAVNLAAVYGQARLPAALASLIITSNPVHTAVISRVLTGEPLGRRKLGGIALAFVGLVVVLRFGSGDGASLGTKELAGVGILAIAPFSWAFYTVFSKPLLASYASLPVAALTTIAGAIPFLVLPVARPGMPGRLAAMDAGGWLAALFVTLISFVVAYLLWYRGLRVLTPSEAAVYIYLVPVFGFAAAWLVLGERPTPYLLVGGATILAGVVLTNSGRATPAAAPRAAEAAGP